MERVVLTTNNAYPDSPAIIGLRGTFDLAGPRTITVADARYTAMSAIRLANAPEIVVVRVDWEVDGVAVDTPVGKVGSRVTANVEARLSQLLDN